MKIVKTDLAKYFNLPNPGLNSFLDRTERGQPDDYRTPFWNGAPRAKVLAEWQKVVDAKDVNSLMPGLYEIEMEQKSKVGPYSIMLPFEQRLDDVTSYFTLPKDDVRPIPREVLTKVKRELRRGSLSLSSYQNTIAEMKLNTNSGAPEFIRRNSVVDETLNLLESGYDNWVAILGWRGQQGGGNDEDVKQRVVWMMPFGLNILELQFYKPLIKAWQTDGTFPALISLRAVEKQVTKLFDTKRSDDLVVATDFSKFDQHINTHLQDVGQELVLYQFNRQYHPHIEYVYPQKFNIPIVCTNDVTVEGSHGMGSGSGGTNADENLIHRSLQHTAAFEAGQELNPASTCLGDDGILSFEGIKVEDVISAYTARGLDMNADKQYADRHSTYFLQRYYHDAYRDESGVMLGVYSTFRALGRLLGQERFYDPDVWSKELVTLRAWSILENTSNSPLFEDLVEFVLKGDKFRLGLDIPGFIDNITGIVDKARDAVPDLLGYTQGMEYEGREIGIKDWKIFKYLYSKAKRG
jgi:hypothetical protein